jgi:uncharacterized protein YutE (UPF0331/DUF86 family)
VINHGRPQLYLDTLLKETDALQQALTFSDEQILSKPFVLRGVKYSLIVIAEAMAEVCQHVLAKQHRTAMSGFSETLAKAASLGVLSDDLHERLAPFLRFRNTLAHGYWKVDDAQFVVNLRSGINDFNEFAKSIRDRFVSNSPANEVGH